MNEIIHKAMEALSSFLQDYDWEDRDKLPDDKSTIVVITVGDLRRAASAYTALQAEIAKPAEVEFTANALDDRDVFDAIREVVKFRVAEVNQDSFTVTTHKIIDAAKAALARAKELGWPPEMEK